MDLPKLKINNHFIKNEREEIRKRKKKERKKGGEKRKKDRKKDLRLKECKKDS